ALIAWPLRGLLSVPGADTMTLSIGFLMKQPAGCWAHPAGRVSGALLAAPRGILCLRVCSCQNPAMSLALCARGVLVRHLAGVGLAALLLCVGQGEQQGSQSAG